MRETTRFECRGSFSSSKERNAEFANLSQKKNVKVWEWIPNLSWEKWSEKCVVNHDQRCPDLTGICCVGYRLGPKYQWQRQMTTSTLKDSLFLPNWTKNMWYSVFALQRLNLPPEPFISSKISEFWPALFNTVLSEDSKNVLGVHLASSKDKKVTNFFFFFFFFGIYIQQNVILHTIDPKWLPWSKSGLSKTWKHVTLKTYPWYKFWSDPIMFTMPNYLN